MVTKNFVWPALLAGAVGIPYMASQDHTQPGWDQTPAAISSAAHQFSDSPIAGSTVPASPAGFPVPPTFPADQQGHFVGPMGGGPAGGVTAFYPGDAQGPDLSAGPLPFVPVQNFAEVFRMDVNTAWARSRWNRISVFSAEPGLTAFRVDLVTGIENGALHGCLTYYFDKEDRVAKIAFRGWCGDPEPFKAYALPTWKLQPKDGTSHYVWTARQWRTVRGALILQNAPVISQAQPFEKVAVFLEVCGDTWRNGVSSEMNNAVNLVN